MPIHIKWVTYGKSSPIRVSMFADSNMGSTLTEVCEVMKRYLGNIKGNSQMKLPLKKSIAKMWINTLFEKVLKDSDVPIFQ